MAENNNVLKKNRQRLSPRKHPYIKTGLSTTSMTQPAGQAATGTRSPLRNILGGANVNVNAAVPNTKIPFQTTKIEKLPSPIKPSLYSILNENENETRFFSHFDGPSIFPNSLFKTNATTKSNPKQENILRVPLPLTHSTAIPYSTVSATVTKIYTDENGSPQDLENTDPLSLPPITKPAFGVIGENRRSLSQSFIPVEKSCIIGGNEIHASDTSAEFDSSDLMNLSSSSLQSVTTGVLGQLQPRSLNSSFSEQFESRLGIHSEGPASAATHSQRKPFGEITVNGRSILSERVTPILDTSEYSMDILKSWGELERYHRVKFNYMERQSEISHKMRTILIDWIAEVANEYEMGPETLHLAVNYLDRFLSIMNVERTKLQLVGTTSLLIAAKFEEMNPPETADYSYVTDAAYTIEQILKMEKTILTALEFDLMIPTALDFALSYCSILRLGDPITSLAMYLVELSLMEGDIYLKFLPSVIAGAAVSLGRYTFTNVYWDDKIKELCIHRRKTINACLKELQKSFFNASSRSQTTIYEKYQAVRYCQVSMAFIPDNGPWNEEDTRQQKD